MPLRKGINLQEILHDYIRNALIYVIDNWIIQLRQLSYASNDVWRGTLDQVCKECKQLRLYLSNFEPHALALLLGSVIQRTLPLIDDLKTFYDSFILNENRWDDLEHISICIFGTILLPSLLDINLDECTAFTSYVAVKTLEMNCNVTFLRILQRLNYPGYHFQKRILMFSDLEELSYPYHCSIETVKIFTQYCPKLRTLNVSGSEELNDDSVEYIIQNKNLQFIDVSDTEISVFGYRTILINLPKLSNICWYSPLEHLADGLTLECTSKIITVEAKVLRTNILCEKFHNLSILVFSAIDAVDLSLLAVLTHLSCFTMIEFDFISSNMDGYFRSGGRHLNVLNLDYVSRLDYLSIIRHCINLKSLSISNSDFHMANIAASKYDNKYPHFRNLNSITLCENNSDAEILVLIGFYGGLTEFHVNNFTEVTFDIIYLTVTWEGFRNLAVFIAQDCPLNINTAYILIDFCNDLCVLGDLECWTLVRDPEVFALIEYIKEKNIALKLRI